MRTTLNIDDSLLKAAKIAAIREGSTLTALIEDALRRRIAATAGPQTAPSTAWVLPAHIDPGDPQAVIDYLKDIGNRNDLRSILGPPKTFRGEPCADVNFRSSSELLEISEKPFART